MVRHTGDKKNQDSKSTKKSATHRLQYATYSETKKRKPILSQQNRGVFNLRRFKAQWGILMPAAHLEPDLEESVATKRQWGFRHSFPLHIKEKAQKLTSILKKRRPGSVEPEPEPVQKVVKPKPVSKYVITKRLEELARPTHINNWEDSLPVFNKITPAALKYVATQRVIRLAQPRRKPMPIPHNSSSSHISASRLRPRKNRQSSKSKSGSETSLTLREFLKIRNSANQMPSESSLGQGQLSRDGIGTAIRPRSSNELQARHSSMSISEARKLSATKTDSLRRSSQNSIGNFSLKPKKSETLNENDFLLPSRSTVTFSAASIPSTRSSMNVSRRSLRFNTKRSKKSLSNTSKQTDTLKDQKSLNQLQLSPKLKGSGSSRRSSLLSPKRSNDSLPTTANSLNQESELKDSRSEIDPTAPFAVSGKVSTVNFTIMAKKSIHSIGSSKSQEPDDKSNNSMKSVKSEHFITRTVVSPLPARTESRSDTSGSESVLVGRERFKSRRRRSQSSTGRSKAKGEDSTNNLETKRKPERQRDKSKQYISLRRSSTKRSQSKDETTELASKRGSLRRNSKSGDSVSKGRRCKSKESSSTDVLSKCKGKTRRQSKSKLLSTADQQLPLITENPSKEDETVELESKRRSSTESEQSTSKRQRRAKSKEISTADLESSTKFKRRRSKSRSSVSFQRKSLKRRKKSKENSECSLTDPEDYNSLYKFDFRRIHTRSRHSALERHLKSIGRDIQTSKAPMDRYHATFNTISGAKYPLSVSQYELNEKKSSKRKSGKSKYVVYAPRRTPNKFTAFKGKYDKDNPSRSWQPGYFPVIRLISDVSLATKTPTINDDSPSRQPSASSSLTRSEFIGENSAIWRVPIRVTPDVSYIGKPEITACFSARSLPKDSSTSMKPRTEPVQVQFARSQPIESSTSMRPRTEPVNQSQCIQENITRLCNCCTMQRPIYQANTEIHKKCIPRKPGRPEICEIFCPFACPNCTYFYNKPEDCNAGILLNEPPNAHLSARPISRSPPSPPKPSPPKPSPPAPNKPKTIKEKKRLSTPQPDEGGHCRPIPIPISLAALNYKATPRILELSKPKVRDTPNYCRDLPIKINECVLKYRASKRIKKLAMPKTFANDASLVSSCHIITPEGLERLKKLALPLFRPCIHDRPLPFRVSPSALRYVPTKRILKLAMKAAPGSDLKSAEED